MILAVAGVRKCGGRANVFSKCPEIEYFANLDGTILLPCETFKPLVDCVWITPSHTIIRPRTQNTKYQLYGEKGKGECSLLISKVSRADVGRWSCNPVIPDLIGQYAVATQIILKGKEKISVN